MVELEFDENGIFAEALVPRYLEYEEPPVQMVEFLRYSGIPIDAAKRMLANPDSEESGQVMEKAEMVMALSKGQFSFKVGYLAGVLPRDEDGFPVLPVPQRSENLKKNLKNCEGYVMFAATIGSGIDRFIRRYEVSDPSMGVFFQGYGAERAESVHHLGSVSDDAHLYGPHQVFDSLLGIGKFFFHCRDRRLGPKGFRELLISVNEPVYCLIVHDQIFHCLDDGLLDLLFPLVPLPAAFVVVLALAEVVVMTVTAFRRPADPDHRLTAQAAEEFPSQ